MRIYTIRELTETRLCAAERCEGEADPGSRLCFRCIRLDAVKLHTTPAPLPDTLHCSTCGQHKPDAEFCHQQRATERRFRHPECRACGAKRRKVHRAKPGVKERETRVAREYRQRQRAQERAQLGWPPT